MAGVIGINPMPFTIRELFEMTEGKVNEQWWHTASILSAIDNAMGGDATAKTFHPSYQEKLLEVSSDKFFESI